VLTPNKRSSYYKDNKYEQTFVERGIKMKQGTLHVIVFLGLVGGIFFTLSNLASQDKQYIEVTIEEGESLWSLSEEYNAKHHYSNWEFIKWVEQKNSVNAAAVFPGQKVIIPVNK
jgi:hypothetical protein